MASSKFWQYVYDTCPFNISILPQELVIMIYNLCVTNSLKWKNQLCLDVAEIRLGCGSRLLVLANAYESSQYSLSVSNHIARFSGKLSDLCSNKIGSCPCTEMRPCKIDSENWTFFSFKSHMFPFRSLILVVATVFDKTQVWPRKSTFCVQIHQKLPTFAYTVLLTGKR